MNSLSDTELHIVFFQVQLQLGRGRTETPTMEWMCPFLLNYFHSPEPSRIATNTTLNVSVNVPLNNDSVTTNTTYNSEVYKYYFHMYQYICMRIIVPILCVFGIIGNVLNVLILIKKVSEGTDNLEKGATLGLIALAISDFTFCACTLVASFARDNIMIFREKDLSYVVAMYWNYVQNVLIKTSTWFTVVLAIGRYFAVCFPMKARQYMRCGHTVCAIVFSAAFWICCKLPMLWTFRVSEIDCTHASDRIGNVYVLTPREYQKHRVFVRVMHHVWAVTGFFIPVGILSYCNYKLVQSLRSSRKFRSLPDSGRSRSVSYDPQRRISVTLVSIVVIFFLLVCPSELLHFYLTVSK